MTSLAWLQLSAVLGLLLLTVRPFGLYMQRVFTGQHTVLSPVLRPIEASLYRLAGVRPEQEQRWFDYALAFLLFHLPALALGPMAEQMSMAHGLSF